MTDRYPHAPECASHYSKFANCDCGAEREQSAFDAGKREGLEEAAEELVKEQDEYEPQGEGWCALSDALERIPKETK